MDKFTELKLKFNYLEDCPKRPSTPTLNASVKNIISAKHCCNRLKASTTASNFAGGSHCTSYLLVHLQKLSVYCRHCKGA